MDTFLTARCKRDTEGRLGYGGWVQERRDSLLTATPRWPVAKGSGAWSELSFMAPKPCSAWHWFSSPEPWTQEFSLWGPPQDKTMASKAKGSLQAHSRWVRVIRGQPNGFWLVSGTQLPLPHFRTSHSGDILKFYVPNVPNPCPLL